MGLFDKKYCDICGEKIGLLGNRKLEDGNLCPNCAKKLSPWFSGRRHALLNDIREQLEKREENKELVAQFNTTKTLGRGSRLLYVDEAKGNFAVCYKSDWDNGNPDIIPLSIVTGCNSYHEEHRTEIKCKDKDGKMVSYNPPQYEYSYDFYSEITVNHPYIDEIKFQLNSSSVKLRHNSMTSSNREFNEYTILCDEVTDFMVGRGRESRDQQTYGMAQAQTVLQAAQAVLAEAEAAKAAAAQAAGPWKCPACYAEGNTGNFCEYCGTKRG